MTSSGDCPDRPLVMAPAPVVKPWGGHRLARLYDKPFSGAEPIGESWEVSARPEHPSRVAEGPSRGRTLAELMGRYPREVLGALAGTPRCQDAQGASVFPLLFKLLETTAPLSVQVHPPDRFAPDGRLLVPGKTEAWYVCYAEPGAHLHAGLLEGVDREALGRRLREGGDPIDLLRPMAVARGDALCTPAGCVHRLGAGLVLAEIQQNSATTYRLHDAPGRDRALHLDEGLAVVAEDCRPDPARPRRIAMNPEGAFLQERLAACDAFVLDRVTLEGLGEPLLPPSIPVIVCVLAGQGVLLYPAADGEGKCELGLGQTALVPGAVRRFQLFADDPCEFLLAAPIPDPGAMP